MSYKICCNYKICSRIQYDLPLQETCVTTAFLPSSGNDDSPIFHGGSCWRKEMGDCERRLFICLWEY
jgi:hypothetical protein